MKKRVVITRPSGPYAGTQRLSNKLQAQGFEPFELPVLACVPIALTQQVRVMLEEQTARAESVWLAFLSPTAVWIWKELSNTEPALERLADRGHLAVQGNGTAEACQECFGRRPEFIPSVFVAEEFAKEISHVLSPGHTVLVPQSADGRDLLAPTLVRKGFQAQSFNLYRLEAVPPADKTMHEYLALGDSETYVVFMSPSAVRATVAAVGPTLSGKKIVSVGPITSQAIRQSGLPVWREASEHSEEGVLAVLTAS